NEGRTEGVRPARDAGSDRHESPECKPEATDGWFAFPAIRDDHCRPATPAGRSHVLSSSSSPFMLRCLRCSVVIRSVSSIASVSSPPPRPDPHRFLCSTRDPVCRLHIRPTNPVRRRFLYVQCLSVGIALLLLWSASDHGLIAQQSTAAQPLERIAGRDAAA